MYFYWVFFPFVFQAYSLLIPTLSAPSSGIVEEGINADLLSASSTLTYLSTTVSPLNAIEFVRNEGTIALYNLIVYSSKLLGIDQPDLSQARTATLTSTAIESDTSTNSSTRSTTAIIPANSFASNLLIQSLKTFTSIANTVQGRTAMLALGPQFAVSIYLLLSLHKTYPIAVDNCMEVISRSCSDKDMQSLFVQAGELFWRLES